MPDKRLQTALEGALIGLLIGFALARFQRSKPHPITKERLRKLNRDLVRSTLINAAHHEENHARSQA